MLINTIKTLFIVLILFLSVSCVPDTEYKPNPTETVLVLSKTIAGDSFSGHMYIVETDKGTCLAGDGGWAYPKMTIGNSYNIRYTMYNGYKYVLSIDETLVNETSQRGAKCK